jgi:hypothetical protein
MAGGGWDNALDRPGAVRRRELYPVHLDEPGMFDDWRQLGRCMVKLLAFGLLVWAAIYELVKW